MVTMTVSAARTAVFEPLLLVEDAGASAERNGGHVVAARLDPGGPQAVVEDDSFLEGLGRLPGMGRHFRAALETSEVHRGHAGQSQGAARSIHGNVATADDQYV
jgi:hypothetical protein